MTRWLTGRSGCLGGGYGGWKKNLLDLLPAATALLRLQSMQVPFAPFVRQACELPSSLRTQLRGGDMAATVNRTLCLDEDIARKLAEVSKNENRPMSRIVNAALKAYFKQHEGE